jgi:hypothetical protein
MLTFADQPRGGPFAASAGTDELGLLRDLKRLEDRFIIVPGVALAIRLPEPNNYGLFFRARKNGPNLALGVNDSGRLSTVIAHDNIMTQPNAITRLQAALVLGNRVLRNEPVFG